LFADNTRVFGFAAAIVSAKCYFDTLATVAAHFIIDTITSIAAFCIQTSTTRTWRCQAFIDIILTILASVPFWTKASIVLKTIETSSSIMTWVSNTIVDILRAARTSISGWTETLVAVHQILTNVSIGTYIMGTVINIDFTEGSSKTQRAITREPFFRLFCGTLAIILTGQTAASIEQYVTFLAQISLWTLAREIIDHVSTVALILTRIGHTIVNILLAIMSFKSFQALAIISTSISNVEAFASKW
jgi:hypothetical protein